MDEILFQVESDDGVLVASWDAPTGGGITTQGKDLRDLQEQVTDAVRCHFATGSAPRAKALLGPSLSRGKSGKSWLL
jgi:hypothetical protein